MSANPQQFKTIQELWREYRDLCYPDGMPAVQNRECHQAFFAGAMCILTYQTGITVLDDDEAMKVLGRVQREVEGVCAHMAKGVEIRNLLG